MKILGVLLLLITMAGCNQPGTVGVARVRMNGHEHEWTVYRSADDGHLYLEYEDGDSWPLKSIAELQEDAWKKEHK